MPTTINSAGITFNDATSFTSAVLAANSVGATQITNGSVTAVKLGTTEQTRIAKAWIKLNAQTTPVTINSSYNVSSVTKSSGFVTINFTTAMSDANYSVVAAAESINVGASPCWVALSTCTASSAQIYMQPTSGGTLGYSPVMSIAVFAN
jgi:hypothetical protein